MECPCAFASCEEALATLRSQPPPEVILLDRPCSGLDPVSTSKIEESLRQLKEKITIIIVPHNVQQAGRVADRVAFLLMGNLVEVGITAEVFENPKDKRTSDYITGRFG